MSRNPRRYIEQAVIRKVETEFAGYQIKHHPQGGITIAEPIGNSTTAFVYNGSFGSKSAAREELNRRKLVAIARAMRGIPADQMRPTAEPPAQHALF